MPGMYHPLLKVPSQRSLQHKKERGKTNERLSPFQAAQTVCLVSVILPLISDHVVNRANYLAESQKAHGVAGKGAPVG